MSRFLLLLLVSMVVAVGCSRTKPIEEVAEGPAAPLNAVGDLLVGEPIRHANLTIFPVSSRDLKDNDRFITLNEGLKAGTVEIVEVGSAAENAESPPALPNPDPPASASLDEDPFQDDDDNPFGDAVSAQVNRLMVINRGEKPLYLMPGELISGGQQDRTIRSEIVIQPTGKPVPIEAFCVERGRWNHRDGAQFLAMVQCATGTVERNASVALAAGVDAENAAEEAKRGKFIASIGNLSKASRLAVQLSGDQGEVWKEVAYANSLASVTASSGAFTGNYAEEKAVARLDPYIAELQKPIAEGEKIVGVIVAINGEVHSMDVFESTPLFRKLWPKLLKSYALDAANAADPKIAMMLCPTSTACEFLREATEGEAQTDVEGEIVMTRRSTENLESFSASHGGAAGGAIMGFGGNAGGVHTSAFSK